MYQLIYHSIADVECSPLILTSILDSSVANNSIVGVTGLLVCHDDRFVQVLEGEEAAVLFIFEKIKRDSRHRDIRVVVEGDVPARAFGNWSMAVAVEGSEAAERLIDAAGHPINDNDNGRLIEQMARLATSGREGEPA